MTAMTTTLWACLDWTIRATMDFDFFRVTHIASHYCSVLDWAQSHSFRVMDRHHDDKGVWPYKIDDL